MVTSPHSSISKENMELSQASVQAHDLDARPQGQARYLDKLTHHSSLSFYTAGLNAELLYSIHGENLMVAGR